MTAEQFRDDLVRAVELYEYVSSDQPERPPTTQFLAALEVKRNATIGLLAGTLFALSLFLFFVVLGPGTRESPVLYVGLAFVVAVSTGATLAVILTMYSAIKLSRELDEQDPIES